MTKWTHDELDRIGGADELRIAAERPNGGLRTPRGQAWVGSGKPGAVPDLNEALSVLGVNLQVDESQYAAPAGQEAPAAEPLRLKVKEGQAGKIHGWLAGYAGN